MKALPDAGPESPLPGSGTLSSRGVRGKGAVGGSPSETGTSPVDDGSSPWPRQLPRAPAAGTMTVGIRLRYGNLGETHNIQPGATSQRRVLLFSR